jgi:hypothetical protein
MNGTNHPYLQFDVVQGLTLPLNQYGQVEENLHLADTRWADAEALKIPIREECSSI